MPSRSFLSRVAAFAAALFFTSPGFADEAPADPSLTTYGSLNPAAPAELKLFAFLVGKWTGVAKTRDAAGASVEYRLVWIGRYVLDGMAIADEGSSPDFGNGAVQGISFRYYDTGRKGWTIEFLNFGQSFIRRQVNAAVGSVTQDGTLITISMGGANGAVGRELYNVVDANNFTYSLEMSQDGGKTWNERVVWMEMKRAE